MRIVTMLSLLAAVLVLAACGTTRSQDLSKACGNGQGVVAFDDNVITCESGHAGQRVVEGEAENPTAACRDDEHVAAQDDTLIVCERGRKDQRVVQVDDKES